MQSRLAWLAGILDGEGCIRVSTRPGKAGRRIATWVVSVENTSFAMLNEVAAIADVLGIKYCLISRPDGRSDRPRSRPFGRINFQGMGHVSEILVHVFPFLIAKKSQAEIVLRAIKHRKTMTGPGGWIPLTRDEKFHEYVELVAKEKR